MPHKNQNENKTNRERIKQTRLISVRRDGEGYMVEMAKEMGIDG
jgi:transcriptional regulator of acetoin/glycerol metabolism